jgi:hypothetical protein
MATIHTAISGTVSYKYHEPKPNNKGLIKGIMYEKVDKNTGEVKLKNGSGPFEKLMLKARGYTKMTDKTARKFLQEKFKNAPVGDHFTIHVFQKNLSGKEKLIVRANDFHSSFTTQQNNDAINARARGQ